MNMPCDKMQPLLSASLDDELTDGETLDVEEHLSDCGDCRAALARMAKVNQMLSQASMGFDECEVAIPTELTVVTAHDTQVGEGSSLVPATRRFQRWDREMTQAAVTLVGVAALIALCVTFGMNSQNEGVVDATRTAVESVADTGPPAVSTDKDVAEVTLVSLYESSLRSHRNHEALCESLNLDLRALRLELATLELEPGSAQRLEARIDKLPQTCRADQDGSCGDIDLN